MSDRLDSSLLSYLELLLVKLPVLKEPSHALITSATEQVGYSTEFVPLQLILQANTGATFVASFAMAQLVLKASILGLETADSLLKLVDRLGILFISYFVCLQGGNQACAGDSEKYPNWGDQHKEAGRRQEWV